MPARQHVEAALQLLRDLGAGDGPDPRRSELDTQREAIDLRANAHNVRHFSRRRKAEIGLTGALREQLDRGKRYGAVLLDGRMREALDAVHPLLLNPQRFA